MILFFRLYARRITRDNEADDSTVQELIFRTLSNFFLFDVIFQLSKRLSCATLTIGTSSLNFCFLTFFRGITHIFGTIATSFKNFRDHFSVINRDSSNTFDIGFFRSTFGSYTFIILLGMLKRQVTFRLLSARKSTLTL